MNITRTAISFRDGLLILTMDSRVSQVCKLPTLHRFQVAAELERVNVIRRLLRLLLKLENRGGYLDLVELRDYLLIFVCLRARCFFHVGSKVKVLIILFNFVSMLQSWFLIPIHKHTVALVEGRPLLPALFSLWRLPITPQKIISWSATNLANLS